MSNVRVFIAHPVYVFIKNPDEPDEPPKRRWKFNIQRIIRNYGEIVTLVDESSIMLTLDEAHREFLRGLRLHKFDPHMDYFLAAGDMTAYAAMMLVSAVHYGATPKQLRHDYRSDSYDVLKVINYIEEGAAV